MQRRFVTLISVGLGLGMLVAQAQTKGAPGNNAGELKQIENNWVAAAKAKDAAKLGDILSDSWVGLSWDGKTVNKAKSLADLKKPDNALTSIEMGPMTVRFFGDTAVVTGSDTEKSTGEGKDTSGKYVWTDVFVKEGGKWRAVASQSAKVPK